MLYRKLANVWRNTERHSATSLPEPMSYGREVEHELAKWASYCDDLSRHAEAAARTFELEQRLIYEEIIAAVIDKQPLCIFIDGQAGTGKTYLIQTICDKI